MRRGATTTRALLILVLLVDCAPRTLRSEVLERQLSNALSSRLHVSGIDVACPSDVRAKDGDRFVCVATAPNGDRLRLIVTQIDDDGSVTWETAGSAE